MVGGAPGIEKSAVPVRKDPSDIGVELGFSALVDQRFAVQGAPHKMQVDFCERGHDLGYGFVNRCERVNIYCLWERWVLQWGAR